MKKLLIVTLCLIHTYFVQAQVIAFNTYVAKTPFSKCMLGDSVQFDLLPSLILADTIRIITPQGIEITPGTARLAGNPITPAAITLAPNGTNVYHFLVSPGTTGRFSYLHRATCAVDEQAVLFDVADLEGIVTNSRDYNVQEATPQIIGTTYTPPNPQVGLKTKKCVTITNKGLGNIDEFYIQEYFTPGEVTVDLNSFTFGGQPVPAAQMKYITGGPKDTLRIKITANEINNIGNLDNVLNGNGNTQIAPDLGDMCYDVIANTCATPTFAIVSTYQVFYSCEKGNFYPSDICSDYTLQNAMALSPPTPPALTAIVSTPPDWGGTTNCPSNGFNRTLSIKYGNAGGKVYDLNIKLGDWWGPEYYMPYVSAVYLDTNSIVVKNKAGQTLGYKIVNKVTNPFTYTGQVNSDKCNLKDSVIQITIYVDSLAALDTLSININYGVCCQSSKICSNNGAGITSSAHHLEYMYTTATYQNACRDLVSKTKDYFGKSILIQGEGELNYPTDMGGGVPSSINGPEEWFITDLQNSQLVSPAPDSTAYMLFETVVPRAWDVNLSTIVLEQKKGLNTYTWPGTVLSTNPLRVKFLDDDRPVEMNQLPTNAKFKFKASLNCDSLKYFDSLAAVNVALLPAGYSRNVFKQTLSYIANPNCACEYKLWCLEKPVVPHCPGCSTDAIINREFRFERISFGKPDNNTDGIADATGVLDTANIAFKRLTFGDTAMMRFMGTVFIKAGNPPINFGYGRVTLNNMTTNYNTLPTCLVSIYRGGTLISSGNGSVVNLTSTVNKYNYSNIVAALPGGGLLNNDSIIIENKIVFKTNLGGISNQPAIANSVYYGARINDPINPIDWLYCDSWSSGVSLFGYYHTRYYGAKPEFSDCVEKPITIYDYLSIGQCCSNYQDNWFPKEVIQRSYVDSIYFKIPEGYVFNRAETEFTRGSEPGRIETFTQPNLTVNFGPIYNSINMKQYYSEFGGNALNPISDNGWAAYTKVFIRPTCKVINGFYQSIQAREIFGSQNPQWVGSNGTGKDGVSANNKQITDLQFGGVQPNGFEDSMAIARSVRSFIAALSGVAGASAVKNIVTKTFTWDNVAIQNISGTSPAVNVWMYIKQPQISTLVIDSVTTGGIKIPKDANGYYRFGGLAASGFRYFNIHAKHSACNSDSVEVYYGWDCIDYPNRPFNDTICNYGPMKLRVGVYPSRITGNVTALPQTPTDPYNPGAGVWGKSTVDMCEPFPVEQIVNSALPADIIDVRITTRINRGLAYVPNSATIEYPAGTAPRPVSAAAEASLVLASNPNINTNYVFNLDVIDPINFNSAAVNGLKGSLVPNPALGQAVIRFRVQPDCNYKGRSRIVSTFNGKRPCGIPNPLNAVGNGLRKSGTLLPLSPESNVYGTTIATSTIFPIYGCGNVTTGSTFFLKQTADPVLTTDSVYIEVLPTITISNFNCPTCPGGTLGTPVEYEDGGLRIYAFQYPQFTAPTYGYNVPFTLTFNVEVAPKQSCMDTLTVAAVTAQNVFLTCFGQKCTTYTPIVAGRFERKFNLIRPQLTLSNFNATRVNDGLQSFATNVTVTNTGVITSEPYQVRYVLDKNNDEEYSPLFDSIILIKDCLPLAVGQSYYDTSLFFLNKGYIQNTAIMAVTTAIPDDTLNGTCMCYNQVELRLLQVIEPGAIGNRVWLDADKDGLQHPTELGVAGVTVSLFRNDTILATTITDAYGYYKFSNLIPGPGYAVRFSPPADKLFTTQNDAGDIGSNANPAQGLNYGKTALITVLPGVYDSTIDAGLVDPTKQSIGDIVWLDSNKNGVQDGTEKGIAGVSVTLRNSSGIAIAATTTNQEGKYLFVDVPTGIYSVKFALPIGLVFTQQNAVTNQNIDSNPDVVDGETSFFSLTTNVDNLSIDAGMYVQDTAKASVGDRVWNDLNKNGIQDSNEVGIKGVIVNLIDATTGIPMASTTTDAFGNYIFNNVTPGTYKISFVTPIGFTRTLDKQGTDENLDSDNTNIGTVPFTLAPNEKKLDVDAGFYKTAPAGSLSLGDYVWYDNNKDGIQNPSEPGASGITVNLINATTGARIANTTTDINGKYLFTDLASGNYQVQFTNLPPTYFFSAKEAIPSATGSDANGSGITDVINLTANNFNVDAGIYAGSVNNALGSIGDKVWFDVDANGLQEMGEPGVPNVTVKLLDANGLQVDSDPILAGMQPYETITDGYGNYIFVNVPIGQYQVVFSNLPAGTTVVAANQGSSDDNDSDADPITLKTAIVSLASGQNITNVDMGITNTANTAAIGDRVWFDANQNGVQDATEKGVEGILVNLYNAENKKIATKATDINGIYLFVGLPAGDYTIGFSGLPAGYVFSNRDTFTTTDVLDSDPDKVTGLTDVYTLIAGQKELTVDAGIYNPTKASLGGLVWSDLNNNGIQEVNEPKLSGIPVTLYNGTTPVAYTVTDANGAYLFSNLNPGTYNVDVTKPNNTSFSPKDATLETLDSDVFPTTGKTDPIIINAGDNRRSVDAGIFAPNFASLGDYVWNDKDGDGLQGIDELPVPGVLVSLFNNANQLVANAVTNADGKYLIENIIPGNNFTVKFSNIPVGSNFTTQTPNTANGSDANILTGITPPFNLIGGVHKPDIDAGVTPKSSLGSFVWYDLNNNGIYEDGEQPVSTPVSIKIYNKANNALVATLSSNNLGLWRANNLNAGEYYAFVDLNTLPVGFEISDVKDPVGIADDHDNDASKLGYTSSVVLIGGTYNPDIWIGIKQADNTASIGNNVFSDLNGNGIRETTEPGVSGITITLYNATGSILATTISDAFGNYKFTNLASGNYQVGFNLPADKLFTTPNQISNTDKNSDANNAPGQNFGKSGIINLAKGAYDSTIDAGMISPVTQNLGDFVWLDANKNGIQEATEEGIAGVTVTIKNTNTNQEYTTVTNQEGKYYFNDLPVGTYFATFYTPTGLVFSPINQGSDQEKNSDVNPINGQTANFTITAGVNNYAIDAGMYAQTPGKASVGDKVWNDVNKNGLQDTNETGIANVVVTLVNQTTGATTATTTTDVFGNYIFNNIDPAVYKIIFNTPSGYTSSPATVGTDENVDSDNTPSGTAPFTLSSNEIKVTIDAGFYVTNPPGNLQIGDRVWMDNDKNGLQDSIEPGITGIFVELLNSSNVVIKSTITDINGLYMFSDLAAGDYKVKFSNLPTGYGYTQKETSAAPDGSDVNITTGITDLISLSTNNYDVDAGIYKKNTEQFLSSIGDKVWYDVNGNGIQDPNEQGVSGVTVTLYAANGTTIITNTKTDVFGNYMFANLLPGDYIVGFSNLPIGTQLSFTGQGTDKAKDSDPNEVTGKTQTITLGAGENNSTIDAGLRAVSNNNNGTIGNRVWYDLNNNGLQNSGEPGVAGVTVELFTNSGDKLKITATDNDGYYLFNNLEVGKGYIVKFSSTPEGFTFVAPNVGLDPTIDNNANGAGLTNIVVLANVPNATDSTVDAGLFKANIAGLSGKVWSDDDLDGLQTAGEKFLSGLTVNLLNSTGAIIATAFTDGNGAYTFNNLAPGTYSVNIIKPVNTEFTLQYVGADSTINSDVFTTTGTTAAITLVAGDYKKNNDAGIITQQLATLGDYVWNDQDGDGIQDTTEPGVPGVLVTLYDASNNPIASAITDGNGAYQINNIPPGNGYYVKFTKPLGTTFTGQSVATSNTGNDSDPNITTGITPSFSLARGEHKATVDAGLLITASIGSYVWYDANNNGYFDTGELPVTTPVKINAYNKTTGLLVGSGTTNTMGLWRINGLQPGTYFVSVDISTLPFGFEISDTKDPAGISDAKDNDANKLGVTSSVTVENGEYNSTLWTGLIASEQKASLGNKVWLDENKNGTQDGTEQGVAGIVVTLYNNAGAVVASTITDAYGNYKFTNLKPGTYQVGFTLPNDKIFGPSNQSPNLDKNSDANTTQGPSFGKSGFVVLAAGDYDSTVDAGLIDKVIQNIGNKVWLDLDVDGVQTPLEPGIAGVSVTLTNVATGEKLATMTNEIGEYYFYNVLPGTYNVTFSKPQGLAFTAQNNGSILEDSDPDFATGKTVDFIVTASADRFDIDAGFYPQDQTLASIGNFVWNDIDKNGLQGPNEPGIGGVVVSLLDATGNVIETTITDDFGFYSFSEIVPGVYSVNFTNPVGFTATTCCLDTEKGSDINGTGKTPQFTLAAGEIKTDVDAGYFSNSTTNTLYIGDKVWYDLNKNGTQDANEGPATGVLVSLLNATSGAVIKSISTDLNGNYVFANLPSGNYKLKFTNLPKGYVFTTQEATPSANGSDVNSNGETKTINLTISTLDVDAGIYRDNVEVTYASIGDKVWYDADGDGLQDTTEVGLPGVTVTLYDAVGTIVGTTTTNALGNYIFSNVAPGSYYVGFTNLPSGYTLVPANQGADKTKDSDPNPITGNTAIFNVSEGENKTDIDAGVIVNNANNNGTIGNRVWNDFNNNGLQEAGEIGIPGIVVNLFNSNGEKIRTTTTDANGNYVFNGLPVGTSYIVQFTNIPTGYVFTPAFVGGNKAIDGNANSAGITDPITLPNIPNALDTTVDAGLRNANIGSLSGMVWNDKDRNGIQNVGELPRAGVTVTLLNATGAVVSTAITDGNGKYLFSNLAPGTYSVSFAKPTATEFTLKDVGSDVTDSDADSLTGKTAAIVLIAGQHKDNVDAGITTPALAQIGDKVWNDQNGNGIQDIGEPGVPAVIVTLYNANNEPVATAITDQNGKYLISDVPAGNGYYVIFSNLPQGAIFTTQNASGSTLANDSDPNKTTGQTPPFNLTGGQYNPTIDAGLAVPTSIGSFVWDDINGDGIYDAATELPIDGANISVYNASNNSVVGSATTGSDGLWKVILPTGGNYYVLIDTNTTGTLNGLKKRPSNPQTLVTNGVADIGGINNDFSRTTASSKNISITTGTYNSTVWAGVSVITIPLSIGITLSGVTVNESNKLTWDVAKNIEVNSFDVMRKNDNGSFEIIGTNDGSNYTYLDNKPFVVSRYVIRANKVDGTTLLSNEVTISRINKVDGMVITPNPVISQANITYSESINGQSIIRVYDAAGKLIRNIYSPSNLGVNTITVDLSGMANGVYMITLETASGALYTKPVTKQ